jgi:hypothetical protein
VARYTLRVRHDELEGDDMRNVHGTIHYLAVLSVLLVLHHCSDGPKKAELSPEEVEQICVYVVSCQHAAYPASTATVSECVSDLTWIGKVEYGAVDYSDMVSCWVDAGTDCDALWRCGNEGHAPEACDPAAFEDRCDGTMMVMCYEGAVVYFDCARYDSLYGDAVCRIDSTSGALECGGGIPCTEETYTCDGDVLEMCMDGELWRFDCRLSAALCEDIMPGVGYCVGTGPECGTEYTVSCDGSTIVRCLGGREARFDCATRLGSEFTCVMTAPDEADCGPRYDDCDGETHVDTCSGTSIDYCRWGHPDSVDCTRFDYASCEEGTGSAFCL